MTNKTPKYTKADLQPTLDKIPDAWGKYVSVEPGWYPIVIQLDQQLSAIDPSYEIHQVKEKFGGLRYYCSLDTDPSAEGYIKEAEDKAACTCDRCGAPGTLQGRSWWATRCPGCA